LSSPVGEAVVAPDLDQVEEQEAAWLVPKVKLARAPEALAAHNLREV
jgi:hypothetical protein